MMKECGITDISLSYFGLRERTKFTKGWDLNKYFEDNHNIFIDSGCHTINSAKEQKYTNEELRYIGDHYYSWIRDNIDSIEFYTEFDALQLGKEYVEEQRLRISSTGSSKFLPIWGIHDSIEDLNDLSERFGRVGILQTSIGERDIIPTLNKLVARGIKLHGLSMTKPDVMKAVRWESVSSTSWISPMQYGDTIIWSHNQLKRYPKSMKDQARKKERSAFISGGFDLDKIYDKSDSKEMLRVSLWSWTKLLEAINKKQRGVTTPVNFNDEEFTDFESDDVGTVEKRAPQRVPTAIRRDSSEKRIIPFLDFDIDIEKQRNKLTNEMEDVEVPKVKIRSESMRICDSCFLATKCPMFEENTTCAYDIPIQIRTKEQMTSLMDSMVELQAQRVLFMKMAEDAEGGYADPVLSSEIDRLGKLMKTKHEMEQEGFSLTVTAKQQGQMSRVDRLFGDLTNHKFTELPSPVTPQEALEQLNISDAFIEEY